MMRYIEVELIEAYEEEGARLRSFCVVLFLFIWVIEKTVLSRGVSKSKLMSWRISSVQNQTQWEALRGNLICTELSFDGKGFVLSAFEMKLSLWASFTCSASKVATGWQIRPLWTCVKLSLRVKPVVSHHGIANYKYATPAVICGGLVGERKDSDWLRASQERYQNIT